MRTQQVDMRRKVLASLEKVQQILDNTKNPILAADAAHRYIDKMTLAEFLTNCALSSIYSCLSNIGLTLDHFQTLKQWSQTQSVSLRLRSEEKCQFVRQETRRVESKTSHVVESSIFGKTTSKVVTEVTDYIWEFNVSYWLEGYRGTGADSLTDCVLIRSRSSSCEIVTSVNNTPKPEHRVVPPMEVSLTWILRYLSSEGGSSIPLKLSYPLIPSFHINKADASCHTPRRNADIEAALVSLEGMDRWCKDVNYYFFDCVFSQAPDRSDLDLSVINADRVFVPVLPLLNRGSKSNCISSNEPSKLEDAVDEASSLAELQSSSQQVSTSSSIDRDIDREGTVWGVEDTNAFLGEQQRSLIAQCESSDRVFPDATAQRSLISAAEGTLLITLLHIRDVVEHYSYGVDYIEEMLRDQLIAAIGKVIQPKDFRQYMKYHNMKLLREPYQPRPFCYTVRRSGDHAPEGCLFLEELGGGSESDVMAEAINTLVSSSGTNEEDRVERQFTLNASTSVKFTGSTYVHAYMSHRFQNDHQSPSFQLRAEARQFSGYIVLIGTIPSADSFDPKHAFICQNKDEFTIPLDAEMIPSPKTFRDAIESLSPEQQRFAKAFRSMQLASTLFGVLVIQIKPQLERILNLPPDSLTKEIKLNQDLMELFIKYQIPSDLLSYDAASVHSRGGDGVVSLREKLEIVKGHVASMHEMIGLTKKQELVERQQEVQYSAPCATPQGFARYSSLQSNEPPLPPPCFGGFGGGQLQRGSHFNSPQSGGFGFGGGDNDFTATLSSTFSFGAAPQSGGFSFGGGGNNNFAETGFSQPASIEARFESTTAQQHQPPSPPCIMETASSPPVVTRTEKMNLNKGTEEFQKDKESQEESFEPQKAVVGNKRSRDCTLIPQTLNHRFDEHDRDGAVRPVVLTVGSEWKKKSQKSLLTERRTTTIKGDQHKEERSAAFDLLDALSRSGGLTVEHTDLHVVLVSTHCFDTTLMNTVIQRNVNPIEKMERSTLIMASVLHGNCSAEEMCNTNQHERLLNHSAMLFQEDN